MARRARRLRLLYADVLLQSISAYISSEVILTTSSSLFVSTLSMVLVTWCHSACES